MATTKNCKSVKIEGISINGQAVYATATGIKLGARGRVQSPADVYGTLYKGDARTLRKALHRLGFTKHAAMSRAVPQPENPAEFTKAA